MRTFICFIVAVLIHYVGGIILWNVVYSFIDPSTTTLVDLGEYRLWTYSGLVISINFLAAVLDGHDDWWNTGTWIAFGNLMIAILVNGWEGMWDVVSLIMVIIYNVVNLFVLTCDIYSVSK